MCLGLGGLKETFNGKMTHLKKAVTRHVLSTEFAPLFPFFVYALHPHTFILCFV